jgi:capsular exopolysaccharide synthesis family protein
MVTSPRPREGKTVTTLNLALSFSLLPSFRVIVVDGDLRRSAMGKWLGATDQAGLSNLIDGSARLNDVIFQADDTSLHFITSGTSKAQPAELLQSPVLSRHLRSIAEKFDLVLIDSPPLDLITDAQLLASGCDAVLLVARAFSTTRKSLEKAAQDLQPFRVIGTVLNGGTHGRLYQGYKSYYY